MRSLALALLLTLPGCVTGLCALGVVGEALEWESLPCGGEQSARAPFAPSETCAEIERAAELSGHPVPHIRVRWVASTLPDGRRGFRDVHGRAVAGLTEGLGTVKVAYLPGDKPCATALRHEARHVLIMRHVDDDGDPGHDLPGWVAFDGCDR